MINYTVYKKCNLFKAAKLIVYLTVLVVFTVILSDTANYNGYVSTVQADEEEYSQEEIDAAKAWLSAHGYPPTRAGAEQAYQDYLDGKLDDDPDVKAYKGETDDDSEDESDVSSDSGTDSNEEDSTSEGSDKSTATDANIKSKDKAESDKKKTEELNAGLKKKLEENLHRNSNNLKLQDISSVTLTYKEPVINNNIILVAAATLIVVIILLLIFLGKKKD
ncbi:MAG: hypothetical protein J6M65_02400 [Eubacterium sp.]|nr:hypothetical protein [Eubacterium sp.]